MTYSIYDGHGPTANADRVRVQVSDGKTFAQVLAYDPATGESLWESERLELQPSEHAGMPRVVYGLRPRDDGTTLLHGDHDGRTARLVARESASGATRWAIELRTDAVRMPHFTPTAMAHRTLTGWLWVRTSDGEVARSADVRGDACFDGETFVAWGSGGEAGSGRLVHLDPRREDHEETIRDLGDRGSFGTTCGTHGKNVIFGVEVRHEKTYGFRIVALSEGSLEEVWRIDLGPWEPAQIARGRDSDGPDHQPLRGRLSDFVSITMQRTDVTEHKLVVLDMRTGRVAWESAV